MQAIQFRISQVLSPFYGRAGLFFIMLTALAVTACTEAAPTATPKPTPAPTPVPAPTLAVPLLVRHGITLPVPDTDSLITLPRLLSLIPGDYNVAVVIDPQTLAESPHLRNIVDLDKLGLAGFFPEGATRTLDLVGLAIGDKSKGPLTVMDGDVDIANLLQLAGGFGISLDLPEPEDYRGHQVWNIDVFGLTLAVGQASLSSVAISSGSAGAGAAAAEIVKSALDTYDGVSPGILSTPDSLRVLNRLPSGFASTLVSRCDEFEVLVSLVDLPGCATAGVSADLTEEGAAIFYIVADFDHETQAMAALAMIIERLQAEAELPFHEVGVGQDGEMIWARIPVRREQIAEALKFLAVPDR